MSRTEELIQNVIDTIDNAHSQKLGLTEHLLSLKAAKQQIEYSAKRAREMVSTRFEELQKMICDTIDKRHSELCEEINTLERNNLEPLLQCEDMINQALMDATTCLEQGKCVLANNPDDNEEALIKFKDSAHEKDFNILPEVPSLSEVAFIDVQFPEKILLKDLNELLSNEGKVYEKAPVQVTELEERPGGLLVKWEEVDEESEVHVAEFQLQSCFGEASVFDLSKVTFHTVYTGPNTSHLVKQLRTEKPYSFRVRCRYGKDGFWSIWSVPRLAQTYMKHYEWQENIQGYAISNENKTGTRTSGLTRVLYSKSQCYKSGFQITFRVLDAGEKSPLDGIGIAVTNDDINTLKRDGAVFLATDGTVFIDGQEMTTKLPCLSRNSCVTIETETLPNGKVRVSVQVGQKELTFDWKIDKQVTLGMIGGLGITPLTDATYCFFCAMIFSHEDWKVGIE